MTATITPQDVALGLPAYAPVTGCRDVIPLCPTTFLHFYNDGAVDDVITFGATYPDETGAYHCSFLVLPAGDEIILGPFDMDPYYPELTIGHSHPGDVTMAALFIAYESEGCDATVSTVYPSIETTCTLVSTCPQLPDVTVIWPIETAETIASACPQPPDSMVVWPIESPASVAWADLWHTDFTVIWCGL